MDIVEQTYEKYAEELNAHADKCPVCDIVRKTGITDGVCTEGQALVDAWKKFVRAEREKFYDNIERLTVEGRPDAGTD